MDSIVRHPGATIGAKKYDSETYLSEEVVYETGVVGQRGSPWQHVTAQDFLTKPVCRVITVNGLFCVHNGAMPNGGGLMPPQ